MTLDTRPAPFRFDIAQPILRSLTVGLLLVAGACSSSNHASVGPTTPSTFTIGGTVSGLPAGASGLVLADGSTTLTVTGGATTFMFPTAVASGTAYAVTVQSSPSGMTCSAASGSGTVATANVGNIVVTCSNSSYTIGGAVTGLTVSGLVLQNGTDTVTVPANATSYTLPTAVAFTSSYTVSVMTQPAGLSCSVANGAGTMAAANVTNVNVTCSVQPFTVGGTVTGLGAAGLSGASLVLANGSDTVTVAANATSFTLPTAVNPGVAYAIVVQTQPTGLTCTVSSGAGTMPAANVTSVLVTCSSQAFMLGGTVTGLTTSGLVLANGSNTATVASGASTFNLQDAVAYTAPYAVTVQTQPTGLTCSVTSATGTMPANDVTTVAVTCDPNSYTLGGTISGLHGSGLVLANSTDLLTVSSNATTFTMQTGVAYGAAYAVTIHTQPRGYTCALSGDTDTMGAADVTSVSVTCTQNAVWAYAPDYNNGLMLQYWVNNTTHLLSAMPVASFPTTDPANSAATPVVARVNGAGTVLYTANRNANSITWFSIDAATGTLTYGGSVTTGGFTPVDVVLNAAGTLAFVPISGDDEIDVYAVHPDGSLVPVTGSPFLLPNSIGDTTFPRDADVVRSIALHPTLPLLYATLQADNSIITMNIASDGTLTQAAPLLPTGSGPYAMVINAAGTHAYTVNRYSNAVYEFSIDSAGMLASVTNIATTGTSPFGIALDPTGKFLYTANNNDMSRVTDSVDGYSVNATSGALASIGTADTALFASTVMVDDTGIVYVTNNGDPTHSISVFSADPVTGVLTPIGSSASASNSAVNSVAFAKP